MKRLLLSLAAGLIVACSSSQAHAVLVKVLIDDFADPLTPSHTSANGTSRAVSPPLGVGGSVLGISGGTDVASDRGLYGRPPLDGGPFDPGALRAGGGNIDMALGAGETAVMDWNVGGYDFVDDPVIVLAGLSNVGLTTAMLTVALWQDGAMQGSTNVVLDPGEIRDVSLLAAAGPTDFLGLTITNNSDGVFFGAAEQVVANPEPATMALIGVGVLGGAIGYRRRRKEDEVAPVET